MFAPAKASVHTGVPLPLGPGATQAPVAQWKPKAQPASLEQLAGQVGLEPVHTRLPPHGVGLPPGRLTHAPVAQVPHGPQAPPQQVPPTQFPLAHWPGALQPAPFACGAKQWFWFDPTAKQGSAPVQQKSPATQPALDVQVVGQVVPAPSHR
jgi:hypothetical protein